MPTKEYKPTEATAIREEWVDAVRRLVDDVGRWSEEKGWPTRRIEREINEEAIGRYSVPELEIDVPEYGEGAYLKPIARVVSGGAGRVDFSAYPTLSRVHLFRDADELRSSGASKWVIHTESRLKLKADWNRETFYDIVTEWLSEE